MSAVPSNSDSIADFPGPRAFCDRVDYAGDLMPRRARIDDSREGAFLGEEVAMTDPASLNPDSDRAGFRFADLLFHQFEISTGATDTDDFHRFHQDV